MDYKIKNMKTKVVHAGEPKEKVNGAVVFPIYQSAMFLYDGEQDYNDLKYIRLNNTPNQAVLHKKLAAIEGGEAALVTSSGMAAISTTLLTILEGGGHLLAQDSLYGGTHGFITNDFSGLGISYSFIKGDDPESWEGKITPNSRAIYVETITNPTIQIIDLQAVVNFAKKHGLISIIDNTFASPVNFNPIEMGFDLVIHSATKYLNGHSDIVAGCVIGRAKLIEKITHKLNHLGGSLDPHACYLFQRGIKTLVLRLEHQNQSSLALAQFLENHPTVKKVNYPGLESHPQYQLAKKWFRGFGGMISFEINGGMDDVIHFLNNLDIPLLAPSLGGVETLVVLPAVSSHASLSKAEREKIGIPDTLVRVSVGIESTEELIADFKQALETIL